VRARAAHAGTRCPKQLGLSRLAARLTAWVHTARRGTTQSEPRAVPACGAALAAQHAHADVAAAALALTLAHRRSASRASAIERA
jgi:hypothetical protein